MATNLILECKKDFKMRYSQRKTFTKDTKYPIIAKSKWEGVIEFIVENDYGERHVLTYDGLIKNHFTLGEKVDGETKDDGV